MHSGARRDVGRYREHALRRGVASAAGESRVQKHVFRTCIVGPDDGQSAGTEDQADPTLRQTDDVHGTATRLFMLPRNFAVGTQHCVEIIHVHIRAE